MKRRSFLGLGMAGVLLPRSSSALLGETAVRDIPSLAGVEQELREFSINRMIDRDGLFRSVISADTLLPFSNDEVGAPEYYSVVRDMYQNSADKAGALTYENSLMATGEFAMSQIIRFQKTRAAGALELARRSVHAILAVAREGRHYMPGYLPKPFGGIAGARYSHETSTDQYTKVIAALCHWLPLASAAEEREIAIFFVDAADYFLARRFGFPWRQKIIAKPETHYHLVALYIPLLQLAAKFGGSAYTPDMDPLEKPLEAALRPTYRPSFNEISLFFDGFDTAMRMGRDDPRLPAIMRALWARGAANIDQEGRGWEDGKETAWATRFAAGARLVPGRDEAPQRDALAFRVMGQYRQAVQMTRPPMRRPIEGAGIASWLLSYWRLHA